MSDLHVDADGWSGPPVPHADVAVVAGDVADGLAARSIPWVARHIAPHVRRVIYVPGNHDFYRHRWQSELARGREAAAAAENIVLLAVGESVVIEGVRFVGATLWTDYGLWGEGFRASTMAVCGDRQTGMRDHRWIRSREPDGSTNAFRPPHAYRAHVEQRARIEEALATPFDGATVVVTHHAPDVRSLLHEEIREVVDAAYASDLSAITHGEDAPALWIHGHVHASRDYSAGKTRVVCNPRGRVGRRAAIPGVPAGWHVENPRFDPELLIRV